MWFYTAMLRFVKTIQLFGVITWSSNNRDKQYKFIMVYSEIKYHDIWYRHW